MKQKLSIKINFSLILCLILSDEIHIIFNEIRYGKERATRKLVKNELYIP